MKGIDRIYQQIACMILKNANWTMPRVVEGIGSALTLPLLLRDASLNNILLITTKGMIKRGTLDELLGLFQTAEIKITLFTDVAPDPTIACIEDVVQCYNDHHCEGIIALGGGSVIDCAKGAIARLSRPNQSIKNMAGAFKIRKRTVPFYAVPTTAGTGSETTITTVVTDQATHYKFTVSDDCLLPDVAILDPFLTKDLPPHLTATTGMDALTHAVEAYTNLYSAASANDKALQATCLIFENLEGTFTDSGNITCRDNMLRASFLAGEAFTRSLVGYVHALAHSIGGIYGVPHGEANAIIMPYVLEEYGAAVHQSLSELARAVHLDITGNQQHDAQIFIDAIRSMATRMGIATNLAQIQESDIPEIVDRAYKEAHTYPTPLIFSKQELTALVLKIKG